MRIIVAKNHVTLHISGDDTRMWAMRPHHAWPGSTLSGLGFMAQFDSNGLCDFDLKGTNTDFVEVNQAELSAICCDLLKNRLPKSHPEYPVAVDQFLGQ